MSNIIDSIRLSGTTYQIQGSGGGGTQAIELTQAQYDALVDKDPNVFYIITDAEAGDLTNYYTKTETDNAITAATSTKQDTLVSGTNIKTINNESILGSGNIDIQGGSTYTAGRGISIANDTISFSLPISAGTGTRSIVEGDYTTASGSYSHAEGDSTTASGEASHSEGTDTIASGYFSHAEGSRTTASGDNSHTEGYGTMANNESEHASGQYNVSSKANNTFGNSGNTLFSVGNGTSTSARHNAFEIRQNGDIYLTKDGQDVKLQDQLGGSSITVDSALSPTSENPVQNKVIYNKIDEVEQVTAAALNELNDALGDKQDTLSAGTNITIIDNVISATGGGGGGTVESAITSGSTNAVESKAIWSATTFNKGVLLTFNDRESTNYPEGCRKLVVEVAGSNNGSDIDFFNDDQPLGSIHIDNTNWQGIVVNVNFDGASYEISGTTVIITYPTVTVTKIRVGGDTSYTYTAVVEGAWVNENTYMKSEVDAIANGLQNNINSKLDATAYTPTVVDSTLNVASQNPVQNQTLYSELRIANGETETTLTFEDSESTNYPNGCTKLNVEVVGSGNYSSVEFFDDNHNSLGYIRIDNWAGIMVNINFDGASYEISGTTVIITYPTVTSVTKIRVNGIGNYVYKAITSLTTPLKDKVVANTTALGGLSLVKLTQAEYDALATKDSSTLYIIVN